jgi:hypothetical protein
MDEESDGESECCDDTDARPAINAIAIHIHMIRARQPPATRPDVEAIASGRLEMKTATR